MDTLLTRQPLINHQGRIIANRLTAHAGAGGDMDRIAQALNGLTEAWPPGERATFVGFGATPVDRRVLDWVAPQNVTLELPGSAFVGEQAGELIEGLSAAGQPLCLDFDGDAARAVASGAKFGFIAFDVGSFSPAQLKMLATKTQAYGIPVAVNVDEQAEFRTAIDCGMSAAAGWFIRQPASAPAKQLNASQANIVRVLNLVRRNADVREIEVALKQDVALTYKLLRYINSAGFGLSCEVQSFRHAVTILGYEKLNKWLSLLLVTASKDPMAPALMHTALIRAHMMEILGRGLVDRQEVDNLFITGAFSMLDLLLGVGMEQALEAMHLPEAISDALLERGGIYAPFLQLAKACEGTSAAPLREQTAMLGLTPEQVNQAQLKALAFADSMES